MMKRNTLLFDFDGVIVDTEGEYDKFWMQVAHKYNVVDKNFVRAIKGTTMPYIRNNYLNHLSENEFDEIVGSMHRFEQEMPISFINGAQEFLRYCKDNEYRIALVTSSNEPKVIRALELIGLTDFFDTIVTSQSITQGKPHPMCYQLAAQRLNAHPQECIVFEDSFMGIESGQRADMKVVALATTNSREQLMTVVDRVISDFSTKEGVYDFLNFD